MQDFRKRLIKGSAYLLIAFMLTKLILVFRSIVIARLFVYLSGDIEGISNLAVITILRDWNLLIVPLIAFSLPLAITKLVSEYNVKDKKMVEKVVQTSFCTMILFGIIGAISYFIFSDIAAFTIYNEPMLSWMIKLNAIFIGINMVTLFAFGILQGLQNIKMLAILQVFITLIEFPTVITLTYFYNAPGYVISNVIVLFINFLITTTITYKILNKDGLFKKIAFDKEIFLKLVNYSLPIFLTIIILRPAYLFGLTLLNFYDESDVTWYRIGSGLYTLAMVIPEIIIVPLMPIISEMQSKKHVYQVKIAKLIRAFIFISLPLFTAGALAARFIIPIVYGNAFFEAYKISFFFILSAIIAGVAVLIETELMALGKTRQILYIAFSNVIIFLTLAFILIPRFGDLGYGIALFVVEYNAIVMYLAYTHSTNDLDFGPLRIPLILGAVFISLTLFIFFLVPTQYLFIAILILFAAVIISEWLLINDEDKKLFNDMRNLVKTRFGKNQQT